MAEDVGGIIGLLVRYGYLIVFIAGLMEALPLLGWLVPGQAIIILAGALAAGGLLSLPTLILIAIPAGIVGDAIGYYIGRRYGRSFIERYGARIRLSPKHLERSDQLFEKYGAFALVIARFSFLTRAVGPILAGMSRMRPALFWPINVLGAVAWSVSYALLGYFFGVGFLALQGTVGKILAWTLLAVVGLYLFYRVLKRYADQFTRDDLYLALMGIASGTVFGLIADRVESRGSENFLDIHTEAFHAFLGPASPFFSVVEALTSYPVLGLLAAGAFVTFFVQKRWWDATLVAMGLGGIILLVAILRPIFLAVLPEGAGTSFPSASAAIPLVLAGVVTYLVAAGARRRRWPMAAAMLGAFVVGLAQISRLAQGDEAPSSVVAGIALGTAWLSVTVLVVEFRLKRNPRATLPV